MIKNVMLDIGGVGIYGIIALSIFFLFFTGMLMWVMRLNKGYLSQAESMPLELDLNEEKTGEQS
ncbi:MAG: cbb3-type cytochrome c oxidase subunit 3 [Verrucomicrobia bacterium]|jgi:cytochrome c oxidase cbb3-type subunit IV|nr:cbb3-type cytochrome c oxidase subunit 3 [Verrucomicrobiota bacterium]